MRFHRAHGLGNDYLLLESGEALTPALVRAVCDRHFGVGSDGILEPVAGHGGVALGLRIHNPDGSEAEKSGNGLRIFAAWHAGGRDLDFDVWTRGGTVRCEVRGHRVRVAMGAGHVEPARRVEGVGFHPVDLGNPHHVTFDPVEDWRALAPLVERSVPGRTNVQFATVVGPHHARASIWERGAGETRSSGSSACAVAVAGVATGLLRTPITIDMEGGSLLVDVDETRHVVMEGPVERIATVDVDPGWLARRTSL